MKDLLGKFVWLILALIVSAETSFIVSQRVIDNEKNRGDAVAVFSGKPPQYAAEKTMPLPRLYSSAAPAVVRIDAARQKGKQLPSKERLGSGFFADTEGHVITNYHVIAGSNTVGVIFADGFSVTAQVIGSDPSRDIAVLKVENDRGVKPLKLGDSDTLEVGEQVAAIGNPLGLEGSLTLGVVSAIGRSITAPNGYLIPNVIQTDALINHGSSGGPLFDPWGRVIGVNTAIQAENSGIGFAVPINEVRRAALDIIAGRQTRYAWLGVETISMRASLAKALNVSTKTGALVSRIVEGSPAAKSKLRECQSTKKIGSKLYKSGCDVIVALGGRPVRDSDDLSAALSAYRPGDRIYLKVVRGKKTLKISAILGERK